jgi:hypothetical protein
VPLKSRSSRNHAVLRHDDDAVSDEVSVAIGFFDSRFVDEPNPVADAGVLVHNHAIQYDVAADAKPGPIASDGGFLIGLVEIRAE